MSKLVIICCRLPNGIILEHPSDATKKVELHGTNKVSIYGAKYFMNRIDSEFWDAWKVANKEFHPFKSGSIFEAATVEDCKSKAKELSNEITGFEPMSTDGKDKRAAGVNTMDNK